MQRALLSGLAVLGLAACGDESDGQDGGGDGQGDATSEAPLAFDPASCEAEPSTSVLVVFGLDDGDLGIERLDVVRETGAHATVGDAIGALTFSGPVAALTLERSAGPLELWSAQPSDFGAIAWVDTRTAEVAFAGAVTWASGGNSTRPPQDTSVLVGGAPIPPPAATIVTNTHWSDVAMVGAMGGLGVRSEAVARYTACGDASIVVYVYTPSVGATNEAAARGLVLVSGRRATTLMATR